MSIRLTEYFAEQEAIFKYFGYVEDWCKIPLEDSREYYWHLTGEGVGDGVIFWENQKGVAKEEWYFNTVYTQRFLPKWVYRGEDFTMIVVDTHSDGNKYLQIFSNDKEIKKTEDVPMKILDFHGLV